MTIYQDTEQIRGDEGAQAQAALLLTVVEAMQDGITFSDDTGRFWVFNAEMERLTGYTMAEANASGDFTLLLYPHPEERRRALEGISTLRSTRVVERAETTITRKDGERRTILLSSCVAQYNAKPMFLTVYRDITALKEDERKLEMYQQALRALSTEIILAEHRERQRLAVGLHDQIGQLLALAKIRLDEQTAALHEQAGLREVGTLLQDAIASMRTLTFEICPPLLAESGLLPSLRWLANEMSAHFRLSITVEGDSCATAIEEPLRSMLYWIARELLINVVKHAAARQVTVTLRRDGAFLRLAVEDDGAGFDIALLEIPAQETTVFGLFSIRERIRYLGGRFDISSARQHGTRVIVTTPMEIGGTAHAPRRSCQSEQSLTLQGMA